MTTWIPVKGDKQASTSQGKPNASSEESSFKLFSDSDIMIATNNLSNKSMIGSGGFGKVYKGTIGNAEVAIKILDAESTQDEKEFIQKMAVLKNLKHENLVKLMGACLELRALVYEFLPRGSLEDCLNNSPRLLTWKIRTRMVYEICSVLMFLHSMKPEPVVQGNLKPQNILLDADLHCRLSDFGLCRFLSEFSKPTGAFLQTNSISGTGTVWYTDPDFLENGKLTPGCDVYSFGVTILRILTGLRPQYIHSKIHKASRRNSLMTIVDSTAGDWPVEVAEYLAKSGLDCGKQNRNNLKIMTELSTFLENLAEKGCFEMSRKCQPDLVVEVPRGFEPTMKANSSSVSTLSSGSVNENNSSIPSSNFRSLKKILELIKGHRVDRSSRVTGENIDHVKLAKTLRTKKVGHADIVSVDKVQRRLMKVPTNSEKSRSKAMELIAARGVESVAIEGEDKDHFLVTGDNIDSEEEGCFEMSRKCQPDLVVEVLRVLEPTMKANSSSVSTLSSGSVNENNSSRPSYFRHRDGERSESSAILVEESHDDVHFSSPPKELDKVSTSEGKGSEPGSGQGSSGTLRPVIFFDYEIHEATNNLNDSSKIGEGGHGSVYKGKIDHTEVAIKILSNTGYQLGIKEFHRETGALGLVRHANLVNLIGTCFQLRALVHEYLPNGSLEDCLKKKPAELTWQIRTRIVYEICDTLGFLHANRPDPLVHGNLNPHNVLFDADFKTKLADFGLYRFSTQGEKSHMMKTFDGSTDYIDPGLLESGIVRPDIDVYSFGKTIIRILTGAQPTNEIYSRVHEARKTKCLMTIVDRTAGGWPKKIVELLARSALKCCKYRRYDAEFMNFYTELETILHDINVDA